MSYSRLIMLLENVDEQRVVKLTEKLDTDSKQWHRWAVAIVKREQTSEM